MFRFFMLILGILVGASPQISGQSDNTQPNFADKPDYTILLVIDGLSHETWRRTSLPNLERMIQQGALVEKLYIPSAAHPRTGAYAELHGSSIPNPVMMAGTVFIDKDTKYLQDVLYPDKPTVFIANAFNYNSLAKNYRTVIQEDSFDDKVVEKAIETFRSQPPVFMRLHLQETGFRGQQSLFGDKNAAWKFNIWADNSPYQQSLKRVDVLIAKLVNSLRQQGILEKTVFFILGDHGQHEYGWHPPEFVDSSITTMLAWGAGIKPGAKLQYAELIDVAPTVADLMKIKSPSAADGRVLSELLSGGTSPKTPPKQHMKTLVTQLTKYRALLPKAFEAARKVPKKQRGLALTRVNGLVKDRFYDESRFLEWKRFKTLDAFVTHNAKVLKQLEDLIKEYTGAEVVDP